MSYEQRKFLQRSIVKLLMGQTLFSPNTVMRSVQWQSNQRQKDAYQRYEITDPGESAPKSAAPRAKRWG